MIECRKCGAAFPTERSLHAHIKAHGMILADYYCLHYPRFCLWSGQPLQFKNKEEYFHSQFANRENMLSWLRAAEPEEKRQVILSMLLSRIERKKYSLAPPQLELLACDLPPAQEYIKSFGSYGVAIKSCKVQPMFSSRPPKDWKTIDFSTKKILIDSREQRPLSFKSSEKLKLDTGDYAVSGGDFDYTFVDRKSFQDFCGTMVGDNYDRFRRQILRCKNQESYLWVVVEADIRDAAKLNSRSIHKNNLKFVFHQMTTLMHEFPKNLQFVWSGGREQSEDLIPRLLCWGKKLWDVDIQFFMEEKANVA